jgi:hypothetical protein
MVTDDTRARVNARLRSNPTKTQTKNGPAGRDAAAKDTADLGGSPGSPQAPAPARPRSRKRVKR